MLGILFMLFIGGSVVWGDLDWVFDDQLGQEVFYGLFLNFKVGVNFIILLKNMIVE